MPTHSHTLSLSLVRSPAIRFFVSVCTPLKEMHVIAVSLKTHLVHLFIYVRQAGLRLVRIDEGHKRQVDRDYAIRGQTTGA